MAFLPKQKRYVYEKSLTVKHILHNLQTYKLATGDVRPLDVEKAREKHGLDPGRVCAALVSDVGSSSSRDQHVDQEEGKKRKRKRRRRKRCTSDNDDDLNLKQQATPIRSPKPTSTCQPLSLVADYSSTSGSSNDEDQEQSTSKSRKESSSQKLEIPSSIRAMFETDSDGDGDSGEEESGCGYVEEEDSDSLGFFRPPDDSSSDSGDELPSGSAALSSRSSKWDGDKNKWRYDPSPLSAHTCWRCGRIGHLPQDCTVKGARYSGHSGGSDTRIPAQLQQYYAQCRQIKQKANKRGEEDSCCVCGSHSNLACCLDCGSVMCDGRGHLCQHLLQHPSHNKLYSYKLGRMVKCCKSTCDEVSVYNLLACSQCLDKAFNQHYSMVTATWSRTGLKVIPNILCCEEHYQWHRMNCSFAAEEYLVSTSKLKQQSGSSGLLSEHCF